MKVSESKYSSCLYFTASALARKVEKLANACWKKIGLATSHAYLLKLVLDEPGLQAGQLSEQLQLTPSTITRLIEKLEEKKLVTRIMEGKTTLVFPTHKAKEMKPQIRHCIEEFNEKYTKILGREESRHFIHKMNLVADKLEP